MPYPESCPECGGAFRNTGTHYTARRNEAGRQILLELGCQNTSRRFWWNFTSGTAAETLASVPARPNTAIQANGHAGVVALEQTERPKVFSAAANATPPDLHLMPTVVTNSAPSEPPSSTGAEPQTDPESQSAETVPLPPLAPASAKDGFVRQLQLDRLTFRQMRSWLMSDEARRAIEVAAGATEATYERLALILFGVELPELLGKQAVPQPSPGLSAEERLELQREKARVRARLRRAAAKAARQGTT